MLKVIIDDSPLSSFNAETRTTLAHDLSTLKMLRNYRLSVGAGEINAVRVVMSQGATKDSLCYEFQFGVMQEGDNFKRTVPGAVRYSSGNLHRLKESLQGSS